MGVTGLWEIVKPCARPIKIETLNRKRLAVDASIWIYQFLKAVRDKEGNALRNSHVVGFFRRICKLLFFGIKPVFVFDGGAPVLKRQTVMGRKRRREGRREDAVRTAGRLLAVQMQRRAEEEDQRRKEEERDRQAGRRQPLEEEVPENLVYVDEIHMTPQERQQSRKFKKTDQYHLPELDVSMSEMGGPNDPRIMSLEELQSYARQFDTGEDINVYDFSKIDYDSAFFTSLPASDRYNILNAARLRSRLRMGHSKEQLDSMFPDRMAFSKFQIERVTERNELTQRLMNINDPNGEADFGINGMGRVAGEKGREYVLVKNDGVEGGWALGVVTNEGHVADQPIDVDKAVVLTKEEQESDEDDGFEDVPIEGLNRLPKRQNITSAKDDLSRQRQASYKSRRYGATKRSKRRARKQDPTSLFVDGASASEAEEGEGEQGGDWEDADPPGSLFGEEDGLEEEDEDLRQAIAMSLNAEDQPTAADGTEAAQDSENDMLDVFQQSAVEEARPIPKGSFRAIADELNKRAQKTAPDSHETTSFGVPVLRPESVSSDDDAMDLQAALAESRRGKRRVEAPSRVRAPPHPKTNLKPVETSTDLAKKAGFSGPLPFEKLDLGSSLLGKKKMQERSEEAAGGFVNAELEAKKAEPEPLPPWFSGDLEKDMDRQKEFERAEREKDKASRRTFQFQSREEGTLRHNTREIIDLDAEDDVEKPETVIDLVGDDAEVIDVDEEPEVDKPRDDTIRMGDMAEVVRVEPPASAMPDQRRGGKRGPFQYDESDGESESAEVPVSHEASSVEMQDQDSLLPTKQSTVVAHEAPEIEDESIDWSNSDDEKNADTQLEDEQLVKPFGGCIREASAKPLSPTNKTVGGDNDNAALEDRMSRSPSLEFEDIGMADRVQPNRPNMEPEVDYVPVPASGAVQQESLIADDLEDEFDDFSDPEEEEMLKALTLEAEEHARFASSLNNKSQAENIADYEKELKQLRNQQKKDRRDADEVTHVMITECQQLLRLFGLPYVTAPMEAEAQCAELVKLGLVDGIVTDDSDCFLFGGTRVYKNMFNQAKFVECYLTSDLEKEFDLTRDKLIQVAHLLGSDYTEGLSGVGHVTALEILSEFHNLRDFKTWLDGVQMQQITKEMDHDNMFRKKFRKKALKLLLPPAFPDVRVDLAYQQPDVDTDPEPFQWGVPDLDALRSFLMATIGWSQERTDEVLVPVIRDMNRRIDEGTQSNITAFFGGGVGVGAAGKDAFAPRKREQGSKRLGTALGRMAANAKGKKQANAIAAANDDDAGKKDEAVAAAAATIDESEAPTLTGRKRKTAARTTIATSAASTMSDEDDSEFATPKRQRKQGTKRKQRKRRQAMSP